MKDDLQIGHFGTDGFVLPSDVQSQTVAVLGIRGSGKSHTATVIAEELLAAGSQAIIIDPTDVWWGLRSSRDGKSDGFPILLLGGPRGDIPLDDTDGAVIADFLVEQRASAVLSLRHLRKAGQRRFVTDFSEQLYHRKGEVAHRTPLMLAIDECDAFVPQKVMGAEARCVGAIEDLVRRGRAAGIGVILISQRAACVNKDVLTQLELLIAHRHTSPQDRKALQEWIRAHDVDDREAEFMAQLASLPRGEAYFWSPGWLDVFQRVAVRERRTYDSSATPKPGQAAAGPRTVAQVDLEALKAKLAKVTERASAPERPTVDESAYEARIADYRTRLAQIGACVVSLRQAVDELALLAEGDTSPAPAPVAQERAVRTKIAPAASNSSTAGGLGRCERTLLSVLAQFPAGRTFAQLSIQSGYSQRSSGYSNALSTLRTAGLIAGGRDRLQITAKGKAKAGKPQPVPRGRELLEYWCSKLGKCERTILQALHSAHPRALSREAISSRTGYSLCSSGFSNALSTLRTLELVTRGSEIRASETFFE